MTKAIYMAIKLDQDIMVTNMCLKFGEDWTNSFQELDRKQSSGRTYVWTRATLYAATSWGHKNGNVLKLITALRVYKYLILPASITSLQVPDPAS